MCIMCSISTVEQKNTFNYQIFADLERETTPKPHPLGTSPLDKSPPSAAWPTDPNIEQENKEMREKYRSKKR